MNVKSVRPRHPITFNILQKVCVYLRQQPFSFTNLMLETACTVAFFGFLRCGEFTTARFDPHTDLCIGDLSLTDDCVYLFLKKSKTDPFRDGVRLKLFKNNKIVCPYSICCKYLSARHKQTTSSTDPLFVMDNGQALSRVCFITEFRRVLELLDINSDLYNGHSFRIGAATSAAAAHVEDHLIKVLGRWSSDAYCRYIRTPQACIRDAQMALTNTLNLDGHQ